MSCCFEPILICMKASLKKFRRDCDRSLVSRSSVVSVCSIVSGVLAFS